MNDLNIPQGYKQTEIGLIPEDWEVIKFETLCKVFTKQTGFDYSAYIKPALIKQQKRDYIPFIQNKDFSGKNINFDTDYFIPRNIALNFKNILLDEKCLLVSISGSIGNIGLFCNQNLAFIGGAIAIAKFLDTAKLDWVMHYMLSQQGQHTLLNNVKAGSHQNLILDDIRKFVIPMPSQQEQSAIATALCDVDTLISELEKLIAKKQAIKTATMQQLLTGKTRLPQFALREDGSKKGYKQSELGEIPEDWEVEKLGQFVVFKNGVAHENCINEFGKYIVVNSKFISTEGAIGKYSSECRQPVYLSDVLMVMSDVPNGRAIAKCYWVEKNNFYTLNQRICSLQSVNIDSKYLFYKLDRNPFYLAFDDGAKQTNLRKQDVLDCPLAIPKSIQEQTAIATILSDMDSEIQALEQRLVKTRQIKQGMMQELLTGKTRLLQGTVNT